MRSKQQSDAVKSAGERLEAIEAWSRRTFIAATVGAAFLGILAAIAGYVVVDYVRLKSAARDAASSFQREMKDRVPAKKSR